MEQMILALFSGAAIALLTAIVTKSNADKKNAIENITQERKKWRDDLRGATVALRRYFENKDRFCSKGNTTDGKENGGIVFHSAAEAKAFFEVRLNLDDPEDVYLMTKLCRLNHLDQKVKPNKQKIEQNLLLFEKGMSHNLKFDWERAKKEVKGKGTLTWILITATLLILNNCQGCFEESDSNYKSKKENISQAKCYAVDNSKNSNFSPIPYKISFSQMECDQRNPVDVEISEMKSERSIDILYKYKSQINKALICILFYLFIILLNNLRRYFSNVNFEWLDKLKCKPIKNLLEYTPRTKLRRNESRSSKGKTSSEKM